MLDTHQTDGTIVTNVSLRYNIAIEIYRMITMFISELLGGEIPSSKFSNPPKMLHVICDKVAIYS